MDKSVWLEQVDTALIPLFKSSLGMDVIPKTPETEIQKKTLPIACLQEIFHRYASDRDCSEIQITVVKEDSVEVHSKATPFNLSYQFEIWTEFQSDLSDLSRLWLSSFFPYTQFEVTDVSGEKRKCYFDVSPQIEHSNETVSGRRLFREIYTLKVGEELDPDNRTITTPKISNISVI